ncbi:TBCC-domain-containing protein [Hortaea werneckii]|nr:TBCC-domain-containing protein [Hortaea werneckii]KAI7502388.1 TBCC-domain-containing protein [Hortaea werneckii]
MADHTPNQDQVESIYQPKDAVGSAIKATSVTAAAGAFISTIQNTLTRQNVGAMGAFTRFGGTTATFAAMGGAYEFTKNASANLRQKDDAYNPALGGLMSGAMLGLRFRSAPAVVGYGCMVAVVLGAFSYTGGKLEGYHRDPTVDEVARKEFLRKNRRRPIEGTLEELGEGRGIYGPGYVERRAERVKNAVSHDVLALPTGIGSESPALTAMNNERELTNAEKFFKYFQYSVTDLQERMARLQDTGISGGERADATAHCQAAIAQLSDSVKDSSSILPAHDQRSYGEAIKALTTKLEDIRSTLAPKPRFSFKNRGHGIGMQKKNESAISISDAVELAKKQRRAVPGYESGTTTSDESSAATTPAYLQSPAPELAAGNGNPTAGSIGKAVKMHDHVGVHIILPPHERHASTSATLSNLSRCVIDLGSSSASEENLLSQKQQTFAGLTLKNISHSLIICGHVSGPIHLTAVTDSVVVVATRQFRMHESRDTAVYLHAASRPIIEDCQGIMFAPLPEAYTTNLDREGENQWQEVDDFKWLRAGEKSPNWGILDEGKRAEERVWRDVVGGGPGVGVDDILKAVGLRPAK